MGRMNGLIGNVDFHEGCDDMHCCRCNAANSLLCEALEADLGKRYDWAGVYHTWLKKEKGIAPETDGGRWSKEALTIANINAFIEPRKEES